MKRCAALAALFLPFLTACEGSGPPQANPEFNDAAIFAFSSFDDPEPANLAFAVRELEKQLYLAVDVEAAAAGDRALSPAVLTDANIDSLPSTPATYPEGFDSEGEAISPSTALPIAVAGLSAFEPSAHPAYLILPDQTGTEPGSPEHYDRSFLEETDACWPDRSCDFLWTENELTKDNFLLTMTYRMFKDYRWVDLNLPDPSSVAEGEPIVNEGEPRWSFIGRSWNPEVSVGEEGNTAIFQSYSIEVWVPRDGAGFVRDGSEENADAGAWTADSVGGGSLRMLALWAESSLGQGSLVVSATQNGIQDIFDAQEAWLESDER